MREQKLQDLVVQLAQYKGWLVYHTFDSRRSQPGYPDLTMVHERHPLLLFVELKSESGTVSPEQRQWLERLRQVHLASVRAGTPGGHVRESVWRPRDWITGRIEYELTPDQYWQAIVRPRLQGDTLRVRHMRRPRRGPSSAVEKQVARCVTANAPGVESTGTTARQEDDLGGTQAAPPARHIGGQI